MTNAERASAAVTGDDPEPPAPGNTNDEPGRPGEMVDRVTELLGRRPQGDYEVAVARDDGSPVVIRNAPLLHSGRPMPTRYWLIDRSLNKSIGRLESTGAVDRAEAAVDRGELEAAHAAYRRERDSAIPEDHDGPTPYGGVGGTRIGVKCLHAHYAYFLAGGDDPVGRWVDQRLREVGRQYDARQPAEQSNG